MFTKIADELRQYLLLQYRNSSIVKNLCDAIGCEVDQVMIRSDEMLRRFCVSTADDYGVTEWEKELGITPPPDATLDMRKALIKARLMRPPTMTPEQIAAIADCFLASKGVQVIEVPGTYTFKIRVPYDELFWLDGMRKAVNDAKPAHLLAMIQYFSDLDDSLARDISDEVSVLVTDSAAEIYPWRGQAFNGAYSFSAGNLFDGSGVFNGAYLYDGSVLDQDETISLSCRFDGVIITDGSCCFSANQSCNLRFNATETDEVGTVVIKNTFEDELHASKTFAGSFQMDGQCYYGSDLGPADDGGQLNIIVCRHFDGSVIFNVGNKKTYDGSQVFNGMMDYNYDDGRAPRYDDSVISDGSTRFMAGGEYYAVYGYSEQL